MHGVIGLIDIVMLPTDIFVEIPNIELSNTKHGRQTGVNASTSTHVCIDMSLYLLSRNVTKQNGERRRRCV